jgi:acetoacetyl-CoA synthetase
MVPSGWDELLAEPAELTFERVPFDHPLWVLYSSGTTGLPKAIVQGQGGILLEHLKKARLHSDLSPGDRFFWFTTTGWMMWNFLVGGLLAGATVVLYDGQPDPARLWDFAAEARVSTFGTSAGFIGASMKAGVTPGPWEGLRAVGSTGSPLPVEGFEWVYERFPDVWLFSTSGGTDLCTAFVGGCPLLPVYSGELQARCLGASVEAWSEDGRPLTDEVGELVITKPMPSMPICFWGDRDGSRYRSSYFEMFPGVWRHGDWIKITERGTAVIYGRSDSTINRGGVRMGTSEIYSAVEGVDDVLDSLVVDVEDEMILFVAVRGSLSDEVVADIRRRVREHCSPRHVPDRIVEIPEVPRTLSNKKLEVPVKKILLGAAPESTASRDSLANPEALDWVAEFAARAPS